MKDHGGNHPQRLAEAGELMSAFVHDTGLVGDGPPRRYLWTDAHAVAALVELARELQDEHWLALARDLVTQVHEVLGRHRADDERRGWISGLTEAEGARHPTLAGLRIGKPRPERGLTERYDPRGEWDRDGQYFHYLTKWMHALLVMANATGQSRYLTWAVELAMAAHRAFRSRSGPPRLYWKMSIDLSRPLVPSAGLHDPLDGLVTCLALKSRQPEASTGLDAVIEDLWRLCDGADWATDDPLGIGGLLFDAGRMAQLPERLAPPARFHNTLLRGAEAGLTVVSGARVLNAPANVRLAFRELGLAIGLQAVELVGGRDRAGVEWDRITPYRHLAETIESFWRRPEHRRNATWHDHGDINTAMLAVCLAPRTFLQI